MAVITGKAVEQLRSNMSSTTQVLTPSMTGYEDSIKRWASSSEQQAGIVVMATSTEDVVKAVQFAVKNGLELAIGGGMHWTFSSTTGGMSINLSKMNGVIADAESKTITAQGGALWADVDAASAPYGLAAVGGTVSSVGVAGLTLHGGYGYLSSAHGLAIDNLLSVEVVLANGQVVAASEQENKDLFWAIRGAGSSFGVVTKFVFRAHEQENLVWGGSLVFAKAELAAVIDFANHAIVFEEKASIMVAFSKAGSTPSIVVSVFYNGGEEAARTFFAPLLSLEVLGDNTAMVPYASVNSWHDASFAQGSRRAMKGSSLLSPVAAAFVEELFEEYEAFVEDVSDASGSVVLFDFFGQKKIMSVAQDATAFANRGALVNVLFAPAWTRKSLDRRCQDWTLGMASKTRNELESQRSLAVDEMTLSAVGEYKNYDGSASTSAKEIYGVNFARLLNLKQVYDPSNVFFKGHNLLPGVGVQTMPIDLASSGVVQVFAMEVAVSA